MVYWLVYQKMLSQLYRLHSIKDELQSMWKYTATAHVKVLFQHLLEGMKTTTETLKKQPLNSELDWGPPTDKKKMRR
jgi:hypothetical protein